MATWHDLQALLEAVGAAAKRAGTALVMFIDELQYVPEAELAALMKGMIWSPSHGDTAFTVPMFDEFMRRIMPGGDWRQA
jgi:hypothetical protein